MVSDHCNIETTSHGLLNMQEKYNSDRSSCLHVQFDDLQYYVLDAKGNRKDILNGMSGCFRAEKLTMIIGPSGAGKTTLLKTISGERPVNFKGTISMNGVANLPSETFRKKICCIPQEFALLPCITTGESLYFAARLKLGQGHGSMTPRLIVEEVAEKLGLIGSFHTAVEKLSGGERKRLSIAMEIVTKPSVLLLDEPTSGLDSAASNQVINLLHSMAQVGCTIACTVHQPSSHMISQFDDVIVLGQGTTFYCGPQKDLLQTFADAGYNCPQFYNVAEFVLEVITHQRDGDLKALAKVNAVKYNKWRSQNIFLNDDETNIDNSQVLRVNNNFRELTGWQQYKVLLLRSLISMRRDNNMTKLRFAVHVIVGFLLGLVFYDFGNDAEKVNSNIACIFFFLLFLFFSNSMPAILIFPIEASVFLREHFNNWYRLTPYYAAKVTSDLPMQFLCPTSFFVVAYYMTGQPMEYDRFLQAWLICTLLTVLGQSIGISVGAAFNTQTGVFLIPALSIPMFLFAGFFLKLKEISIYFQPLCIISFFRYAFEGFMQAVYGSDRKALHCSEVYCYLRSPKKILSIMDMPSITFHITIFVLISWILLVHVSIYTILWFKLCRTRTRR